MNALLVKSVHLFFFVCVFVGLDFSYALDPARRLTQYAHTNWHLKEGLPQSTVTSIVQTSDGYLWIGTFEGLVRFDGIQFEVFNKTTEPVFISHSIISLTVMPDSSLWIGTGGGGIVIHKNNRFYSAASFSPLSERFVNAITMDHDKRIWIATDRGLYHTNGDSLSRVFLPYNSSESIIHALQCDLNGNIWVGSHDGLYMINSISKKIIIVDSINKNISNKSAIHALSINKDNRILVGTNNGFFGVEQTDQSYGLKSYSEFDIPNNTQIYAIRYDRHGNLWLGSSLGLFRWNQKHLELISAKEGLMNNTIISLYEDREGIFWFGSESGGLSCFKDALFITYGNEEGILDNVIQCLFVDRKNRVWLGTDLGVSMLDFGNQNTRHTSLHLGTNGLPNFPIHALYEDPEGAMWIGTDGGGLTRWSDGKYKLYNKTNGLTNNFINVVLKDRSGIVWIGTKGGLHALHHNNISVYTTFNGLNHDIVRALHEDRKGGLWIGTGSGVNILRNSKFESFKSPDETVSHSVMTFYEEESGDMWIGTHGGGIIRYHDGHFKRYSSRDGLFDDVVFSILEDDSANFWMSCNRGIFRINKHQFEQLDRRIITKLESHAYGIDDGMKTNECNGGAQYGGIKDKSGRLWFATINGVSVVDPSKIVKNFDPPYVVITRFADGQQNIRLDSTIFIPAGHDRIEFYYTGLSYSAPGKIRFKFKLDGYDNDWIDAGYRRTAVYTNIPPGTYRFQVIAANASGIWNTQGASLDFVQQPFFYQTWWFVLLCLTGVVFVVLGAYRYNVRQLIAREQQLAALVQMRTRKLEEEKERTENALQMAESARRVAEREREIAQQASETKSQLLGIAAHDLRNPLQGIVGYTDLVRVELNNPEKANKDLDQIQRSSSQMLHLINGLLETMSIESGKLKLNKEKTDVSEITALVIQDNLIHAEKKAQRIHFHPHADSYVWGDAIRLRESFENIVNNAIKYSPRDSEIDIKVEATDSIIRFSVRDRGPGLTLEDRRKLFGKFQRLSAKPTGRESSTGLGLAIVKQLVELHDGQISVESTPGEGAVFIIELPRYNV
ncbi:ATP-binding protein [bacterium]|nr:ATP-binding protein [bacterium]NUN45970.1 hypothetical protein [bacterium]